MSSNAILTQFSNLLKSMESIGPKMSSNIRPTRDQLNEFRTLGAQFKTVLASFEGHLELLLRKEAPSDNDIKLAKRIRSVKKIAQISPSLTTTLRKNIVLIFRGPDESVLDTTRIRYRKAKTRARCEKIRAQSSDLILMWSMSLQTSEWNTPSNMTDNTFDFLIQELKIERFDQIPPTIIENIQCLKEEEPLKNCESFQKFVKSTEEQHATMPTQVFDGKTTQNHEHLATVPSKRQRTEGVSIPNTISHEADDRLQHLELIKRSNGKK
ncbi:hypothetical protein EIK77_000188 [Talaromyces pinophilus]|nr:hypothetical protein EIK77_000188 [Talaromyces pinophilus]